MSTTFTMIYKVHLQTLQYGLKLTDTLTYIQFSLVKRVPLLKPAEGEGILQLSTSLLKCDSFL